MHKILDKGKCCPEAKGGRQVNKTLYAATIQRAANRVQSEDGLDAAGALGGWRRGLCAVGGVAPLEAVSDVGETGCPGGVELAVVGA